MIVIELPATPYYTERKLVVAHKRSEGLLAKVPKKQGWVSNTKTIAMT
jgi:hypothetical protein